MSIDAFPGDGWTDAISGESYFLVGVVIIYRGCLRAICPWHS
jgi:hypothetical protein